MSSPFKQKGKKPPASKTPAAKTTVKEAGGGYGSKAASKSDGKSKSKDTVKTKGTVAGKHGSAGISGRTSFGAASKALALNKGESGADEYTIADVLRRNA